MSAPLVLRGIAGPVSASIEVPGSKSHANRALVCAFLASGDSYLSGIPNGDDVSAMVSVFDSAGAIHAATATRLLVRGGSVDRLPTYVWANLAGTTSRFLTAVAALCSHEVVVDGASSLRRRPMGELHDALRALGARVDPLESPGHLPVTVGGQAVTGYEVHLRANVSSQFISALMLIGPALSRGIVIGLDGDVVSAPYISMTAKVMGDFGASVRVSRHTVSVEPGGYRACHYEIEPDFSSAAFPIMATVITGGTIRIRGLSKATSQGDARVLEIAERLGAEVRAVDDDVVVTRDPGAGLHPIVVNMADCSDLVPVVATACLFARGSSSLTGIGFIRQKESNRLEDLAIELGRIGGRVRVVEDGLEIEGGHGLHASSLSTHDDHRLAMAFASAANAVPGLSIEDPLVVSKSWPTFFDDMAPVLGVPTYSTLGFEE